MSNIINPDDIKTKSKAFIPSHDAQNFPLCLLIWLLGYRYCVLLIMECVALHIGSRKEPLSKKKKRLQGRDQQKPRKIQLLKHTLTYKQERPSFVQMSKATLGTALYRRIYTFLIQKADFGLISTCTFRTQEGAVSFRNIEKSSMLQKMPPCP